MRTLFLKVFGAIVGLITFFVSASLGIVIGFFVWLVVWPMFIRAAGKLGWSAFDGNWPVVVWYISSLLLFLYLIFVGRKVL